MPPVPKVEVTLNRSFISDPVATDVEVLGGLGDGGPEFEVAPCARG
ncbi:hypothetical protein MGP2080_06272 [marine gamma proteobacterium HTCC2080]|jgi:hypothetical protein|nr:hypothetical protein MGP2080_06272 [marine gamma proteobacterium HTCC2080]